MSSTKTSSIPRPEADEYAPYFNTYLSKVTEEDVVAVLESQPDELQKLLGNLDDHEASQLHAPYTWSLKQVMGHLIDNEAIFAYRARCLAAQDKTPLPGYEQDDYVTNIDYSAVSMAALLDEFRHLRTAFLLMCRRLPVSCWQNAGIVDGKQVSVRAIVYLQAGHVRHHQEIMQRRLKQE